ncbi:MAG: ABC transporter ATP-binding protein [Candidatus Omnitrophica bacterium]|nr:ABC transporter ATP-binding protein [Candidatus Omnitrophota bacterium]
MTDYTIRTRNLTIDFESVRAVDHLTLDIPTGIVFGFLGPNGAGKTTTIRLLLGILDATEGDAEVLGYDLRTQSAAIRERTGSLLEYHGLYERLSAEDNLEFFGRICRIPSDKRKERIKELLSHLGLWERRKDRVKTWSRGMKQKLAVARALFAHPSLVFLDEPTAGFDPESAASLRQDLADLVSRENVTVFLTTHNLVEAEKLCSLVGVIRKGKLVALGHPDELRSSVGSIQVKIVGGGFSDNLVSYLRSDPTVQSVIRQDGRLELQLNPRARTAPLVRFLVEQGAEIEEVRKGISTLEDAYMALMEEGEE